MREKLAGHGLATLFVLLAIALLLAERAPPLLAVLTFVCAAAAARWSTVAVFLRANPVATFLALLLIWMLISASWSVAGAEALSGGVRIALMIVVAAALPVLVLSTPRTVRVRAAWWATFALCLMGVLLLIETLFDMPLLRAARYVFNDEAFVAVIPPVAEQQPGKVYFHLSALVNRLTHLSSVVAICALPLVAFLWARGARSVAIAVAATSVLALALSPAQAPLVALALGGMATAIVLVPAIASHRALPGLSAAAVAVAVIAMPWFAQSAYERGVQSAETMDVSVIHRLAIWDNAASLIAERPVAGYGIEASRAIGRSGLAVHDIMPGHEATTFQVLPLHPHNASIQIWLELGGIGALMFAAFAYFMTLKVWSYVHGSLHHANLVGAGLMGGWVTALVIAHLSYGIWQYWWIATLGFVAAMLAVMVAARDLDPRG